MPKKFELKDSYLIKKDDKHYIHFCIEIEEKKQYKAKKVYGIDFGLKNPITLVNIKSKETKFLGKELKQIKGKYFNLRRKLGRNKNLELIKKIKNKEKNKVNSLLDKLSKEIINDAYKNKACIVIGKLKHLKKDKGRRFNRKLSGFSYYKLTNYLSYKAKEKGVPLILVSEQNTSKTCNVCGIIGKRTKNWFKCSCGYEDNADRNAAFNIGKLDLSYMLRSGVESSTLKSLLRVGKVINPYEETSTINMQNCVSA